MKLVEMEPNSHDGFGSGDKNEEGDEKKHKSYYSQYETSHP